MAVVFGLNPVRRVACSDASDTGYGDFMVELGPQVVRKAFGRLI